MNVLAKQSLIPTTKYINIFICDGLSVVKATYRNFAETPPIYQYL